MAVTLKFEIGHMQVPDIREVRDAGGRKENALEFRDSIQGPKDAEKRRTPRVGVELWAQEQCEAGVYYHRITNLSPEGFFVEKKIPFRVGQVMTMRLELPGAGRPIQAPSRVVDNYRDRQSNLLGAGFQFLELEREARRSIQALVAENLG